MELKCPSCLNVLNTAEGGIPRGCPACGAAIEVLDHSERLTLLSAKKPTGDLPAEDPVLAGYTKWRARAVFVALLGFAIYFFTFMDLKNSYLTYGYYFWKNRQNIVAPLIAGAAATVFVVAGLWLFRYVGKQKRKYEEGVQ